MRSFLAPLASASAALTACASETAERSAVEVTNGTTGNAAVTAAASAPVPEPVSAAENPHPGTSASAPRDAPAETPRDGDAQGRRTISTAFVRLGPGGHLLVTLRDGSELALRDVTMEKRAFCGVAVAGGSGERQCRGYAEVVAARAVDAAIGVAPVPPG